jgi:Domain of unknown function (DUF1918)
MNARPPRSIDDGEEVPMKAQVGDHLVPDGDDGRAAVVIAMRNADGSPPYVVRWLSDGHIALVFPGPYTRVVRGAPPAGSAAPATPPEGVSPGPGPAG